MVVTGAALNVNEDEQATTTQNQVKSNGDRDPVPPKDDDSCGGVELTDDQLKEKASLIQAIDTKTEGNKLFGEGQYEDALSQYELALQVAPDLPSSIELKSICHANRAICYSKLGKYEETIKECTKALELNPSYMKALIRRGETHEKLDHFEEAFTDMREIMTLDPSNDQAIRAVLRLQKIVLGKNNEELNKMMNLQYRDSGVGHRNFW